MKNKKGFTLVELLVVIGILGVLVAIAVPSSIGISNRIKEKMYESKVKTIETAAGMWAANNKNICISKYDSLKVEDLLNEGYLKADKSDNGRKVVTNPSQTEEISSEYLNKYSLSELGIERSMVCDTSHMAADKLISDNTVQIEQPDFNKSYPIGRGNVESSKSGLYKDNESNVYYYRGGGSSLNNYVDFAHRIWRIIRINEDGTIRLLSGSHTNSYQPYNIAQDDPKYVGYTYDNTKPCTNANPCESDYDVAKEKFIASEGMGKQSSIKVHLENFYYNYFRDYDDKIALETFCNDTSIGQKGSEYLYFGNYTRSYPNSSPKFKCPDPIDENGNYQTYGGVYKLKIGLITADELAYAGIAPNDFNTASTNFLSIIDPAWTMTPYDFEGAARVIVNWEGMSSYFYLKNNNLHSVLVRPVINLKADVELYTDGTGNPGSSTNPYKVK